MRYTVTTTVGSENFYKQGAVVHAILHVLDGADRPLTRDDIDERLSGLGVACNAGKATTEISGLLQRLKKKIGAVYQPDIPGGTWRWCLSKDVRISVETSSRTRGTVRPKTASSTTETAQSESILVNTCPCAA